MATFSADWLKLREPFDTAARASGLVEILKQALESEPSRLPLQVVDLGAGTGANLRYTAPLLGGRQDWLLIDHDRLLLDAAIGEIASWAQLQGAEIKEGGGQLWIRTKDFECGVRTQSLDLAKELDHVVLPQKGLIVAAALLDLVSETWLLDLAERAVELAATVWFALTYDGRMDCNPPEPEDANVRALFNGHQRTDKGFGPALGPSAAQTAARVFAGLGYRTRCAASDWRIGPSQQAMQNILADNWFAAASEMDPLRQHELQIWLERRRTYISSGQSEVVVGHLDVVGLPL